MTLLSFDVVRVPDDPQSVPCWPRAVRAVARGCELGWSDQEMWEELFTDEQRLKMHKTVYGNKSQRRYSWKRDSGR